MKKIKGILAALCITLLTAAASYANSTDQLFALAKQGGDNFINSVTLENIGTKNKLGESLYHMVPNAYTAEKLAKKHTELLGKRPARPGQKYKDKIIADVKEMQSLISSPSFSALTPYQKAITNKKFDLALFYAKYEVYPLHEAAYISFRVGADTVPVYEALVNKYADKINMKDDYNRKASDLADKPEIKKVFTKKESVKNNENVLVKGARFFKTMMKGSGEPFTGEDILYYKQ
ncbi:hypothetical protein AAIR98_001541 [Elusimicrobium simillimum]|uniref:hypothetical protein n=1 Tax=Elusimicrobium simillimum TaxID=3143438 RepID=UPI003C6F3AB5